MERIIKILKEIKECHEKKFIENSIIVYNSKSGSVIPDTKSDLEMIIQLNCAISILQNTNNEKSVVNGD